MHRRAPCAARLLQVTKGEVVNGKAVLTVEPSKGGAAEKMEADAVLVSIGGWVERLGDGLRGQGQVSLWCWCP